MRGGFAILRGTGALATARAWGCGGDVLMLLLGLRKPRDSWLEDLVLLSRVMPTVKFAVGKRCRGFCSSSVELWSSS